MLQAVEPGLKLYIKGDISTDCADGKSGLAFLTVSISKSRMYSFLQLGQRSAKQLPCSSASLSLGIPDRR